MSAQWLPKRNVSAIAEEDLEEQIEEAGITATHGALESSLGDVELPAMIARRL